MTEITWHDPGSRLYEYGVDKVVLFTDTSSSGIGVGVPWNGVASISEAPTGDFESVYYDGIKITDLVGTENYEADLSALNSPPEFAQFEGRAAAAQGLYVTGQPRRRFHLSYRTLIGEASDPEEGYLIHLVYNLMAAPSNRTRQTLTDTPEPMTKSWKLKTTPARMYSAAYKPTAHLILDSRTSNPTFFSQLEETLYGTVDLEPSLLELPIVLYYASLYP